MTGDVGRLGYQREALADTPAAGVRFASWPERLAAWLLDQLIFTALAVALFLVAGLAAGVLTLVNETLGSIMLVVLSIIAGALVLVPLIVMEAGPYGQTPGKRIMRIRVVDDAGRPISRKHAVGRALGKMVSALPLYIGFLWPLWDRENRALHDIIATTRVVAAPDLQPTLGQLITGPFSRRSGKEQPASQPLPQ